MFTNEDNGDFVHTVSPDDEDIELEEPIEDEDFLGEEEEEDDNSD